MHLNDSPAFEPDIGNGDQGFQESIPAGETVLAAAFMNAVQEELKSILVRCNVALRASSAADTAALWNQCGPALNNILYANNIIGFGGNTIGLTDQAPAINAALADNGTAYIPPGDFRLYTALVIPAGGQILGAGEGLTKLICMDSTTTLPKIDPKVSCQIENLTIEDFQPVPATTLQGVNIGFVADDTIIMNNVTIEGFDVNLKIYNTSIVANQGTFKGTNLTIKNPRTATGWGLSCNGGELGEYGCKNIQINNIDFPEHDDTNFPLVINPGTSSLQGAVNINNVTFDGGIFYAQDNTQQVRISNVHMDLKEIRFDGTKGGFLEKVFISSTIITSNNFGGNASLWFWKDVKYGLSGVITASFQNYNGIRYGRKQSVGEVVANGAIAQVMNFDTLEEAKMANNSSFSYVDPWNVGNKTFKVQGYGNGRLTINIIMNITGSTITTADGINVDIISSVGQSYRAALVYSKAASHLFIFESSITIEAVSAATIKFQISNTSGDSLAASGEFIVEGL